MSDGRAGGQNESQAGLPALSSILGTGPTLKPGLVVADKYRLEVLLGRGAMGAVWAATHMGLGGPVALKFIDPRFAAAPEARSRFETEARATAKIHSRFVVSVFDIGQLPDGTLFLVMERLRGETLNAYVKRQGPLPLSDAVGYLCHVGRALAHAHARGIIHRDIKPSNIFLADTPDDGRIAKVLDFGVAKLSSPLEGWTGGSQTSAGALLGTPQYMSPEQARGQGGVDHRTDIYSLGLVFFRMFTGRPVRSPGAIGDLIARILTQPLPRLSDFRLDAPKGMDDWFARVCAADPDERFESVEACVEALVNASGLTRDRFVAGPRRVPGPTGRMRGPEIDELRDRANSTPWGDLASGDDGVVTGGAVLPSAGGSPWGRSRHPLLVWGLGTLSIAIACTALGAMLSRATAEGDLGAGRAGPNGIEVPAASPEAKVAPPEPKIVAPHELPVEAPAAAAPAEQHVAAASAEAQPPAEPASTQPTVLAERPRLPAASPRGNAAPRAARPKAPSDPPPLDLGY